MRRLIIFSDLDGTFLNHHTYDHKPASELISVLREHNIPVIFASSKTLSEISKLQEELNLTDPFIVENGAGVSIPKGYFPKDSDCDEDNKVYVFSENLEVIREKIVPLQKEYKFRGFSDYSLEELIELTSLSMADAINAKDRICSEPIRWLDSQDRLIPFTEALEEIGLRIVKGGRFHHIIGYCDKSIAMTWLLKKYKQNNLEDRFISIALGDSPNDFVMLNCADIPVVIDSGANNQLKLSAENVMYPKGKGPEGWFSAVNQILKEFNIRTKTYG